MSQKMTEVTKGPMKYSNTCTSLYGVCVCVCPSSGNRQSFITTWTPFSVSWGAFLMVSKGTKRGRPVLPLLILVTLLLPQRPSVLHPPPQHWHTALSVVSNQKQLDHFQGLLCKSQLFNQMGFLKEQSERSEQLFGCQQLAVMLYGTVESVA